MVHVDEPDSTEINDGLAAIETVYERKSERDAIAEPAFECADRRHQRGKRRLVVQNDGTSHRSVSYHSRFEPLSSGDDDLDDEPASPDPIHADDDSKEAQSPPARVVKVPSPSANQSASVTVRLHFTNTGSANSFVLPVASNNVVALADSRGAPASGNAVTPPLRSVVAGSAASSDGAAPNLAISINMVNSPDDDDDQQAYDQEADNSQHDDNRDDHSPVPAANNNAPAPVPTRSLLHEKKRASGAQRSKRKRDRLRAAAQRAAQPVPPPVVQHSLPAALPAQPVGPAPSSSSSSVVSVPVDPVAPSGVSPAASVSPVPAAAPPTFSPDRDQLLVSTRASIVSQLTSLKATVSAYQDAVKAHAAADHECTKVNSSLSRCHASHGDTTHLRALQNAARVNLARCAPACVSTMAAYTAVLASYELFRVMASNLLEVSQILALERSLFPSGTPAGSSMMPNASTNLGSRWSSYLCDDGC
jgi:hypothetical protein